MTGKCTVCVFWGHGMEGEKGNISHSLHTLEARGWIVIGRAPGGKADYLDLTPEGLEKASEF